MTVFSTGSLLILLAYITFLHDHLILCYPSGISNAFKLALNKVAFLQVKAAFQLKLIFFWQNVQWKCLKIPVKLDIRLKPGPHVSDSFITLYSISEIQFSVFTTMALKSKSQQLILQCKNIFQTTRKKSKTQKKPHCIL